MKRLSVLGVHIASILLTVVAPSTVRAADRYVTTTGSDSAAGSAAAPFASIGRALQGTSPGDVIHVGDGTFLTSDTIDVPVGVSLKGEGRLKSVVVADRTGGGFGEWNQSPLLRLASRVEAVPKKLLTNTYEGGSSSTGEQLVSVDGNQSIEGLGFDGMRTKTGDYWNSGAYSCVLVENRNGVKLRDVRCQHAWKYGVQFLSTWRANTKNDELSDFEVEDAAFEDGGSAYGNVSARGTFTGLSIHDGTIRHFHPESAGYGVKIDPSYTVGDDTHDVQHGLRIYRLTVRGKADSAFNGNYSPNFSIEIVSVGYDDVEIYANELENQLSLPENFADTTVRSVFVHHNLFVTRRGPPIELGPSHAVIEYNLFDFTKNNNSDRWNVIGEYNAGPPITDVWIRRNVFIGVSGSFFVHYTPIDDFRFVNNVVDGTVGALFESRSKGKPGRLIVANNLLLGSGALALAVNGTPSAPDVRGNLWNGYTSFDDATGASNVHEAPDLLGGPGLLEHYAASSATSNLVDRGVDVGVSFLGLAPDRGAFEWGGSPFVVGVDSMPTSPPIGASDDAGVVPVPSGGPSDTGTAPDMALACETCDSGKPEVPASGSSGCSVGGSGQSPMMVHLTLLMLFGVLAARGTTPRGRLARGPRQR